VLRLEKAKKPARLFSADEVRRMLQQAKPQLRAMILMGINCALGNSDIGQLPITAIDLDKRILDYPRPKTGIDRRCILWPETVEALRAVLANRKQPVGAEDRGLVFITRYAHRFIRVQEGQKKRKDGKKLTSAIDAIGLEFGKLLDALGIERQGVGFYALRHTFRTVADDAGDQRAIDRVMGHHRETDIANVYRHGIPDERLRKVSDHVRAWLGVWQKDGSKPEQVAVVAKAVEIVGRSG
jgi:integrase